MILSCGPVTQPLIGMFLSGVICIIVFCLSIKKVKQTSFYQEEYVEFSTINKLGYFAAFLIVTACFLAILFFILAMIITGIAFQFI